MKNTVNKTDKILYVMIIILGVLAIISSVTGILYATGGKPFEVTNIYGETIEMWGDGLYKNDSFFAATISRGTDCAILFFLIPTLFIALIIDIKNKSLKSRLFLVSAIGMFVYSSSSYCFGVTYNQYQLIYITMLSCSLFGLLIGIRSINKEKIISNLGNGIPYKNIYTFCIILGISLIAAWLPDILTSLFAGKPLSLIETYTTQITYVIDMGILGPSLIATVFLIRKKDGLGYIAFLILSLTGTLIIPVLVGQSIFQSIAGIETPLIAMITKIGSFLVLGLWAIYLQVKVYKNIKV